MFDSLVAALAGARTPAQRVAAYARVENAACARRLSGMADMLHAAYTASGSADRDQWVFDNWAAVCAQIAAAHGVTSGVASGLLQDAEALRERLRRVAELFATGAISYRLVHLICLRTSLVKDPEVLRRLDAAIAAMVASAGAMSMDQAQTDIDALVHDHDPYAVRRTTAAAKGRKAEVYIDKADGSAHVDATVSVLDGEAFDRRIDALARTVCHRDPRDMDDRRAAAVGAMGFGWDRLPCMCQHPDCDATEKPAVGGIVIHVIGRQDTVDGADGGPAPQPPPDDDEPAPEFEPPPDHHDHDHDGGDGHDDAADLTDETDDPPVESELRADPTADPEPRRGSAPVGDLVAQRRALARPLPPLLPRPWYTYTWSGLSAALNADPGEYCPARPGVIIGGGVVPAPVVAEAAMHATIRTLIDPGQSPPEPRYRPSRHLADWVRCRDRTCRFPGCNKPATACEIDHVIPYPHGPTTASNLACLCTEHHLLKTFWPGWSVRLFPDGTMQWADPDGQSYTTHPGSRLMFPELCTPAAEAVTTGTPPPKHTAGLTMPRRKTTRAEARRRRIDDERRRNAESAEQHLREAIPPF